MNSGNINAKIDRFLHITSKLSEISIKVISMKNIMYYFVILVFCTECALAETNKTLQFNAVENSQTLNECDIETIAIKEFQHEKYIAIKLTKSGIKKPANFTT